MIVEATLEEWTAILKLLEYGVRHACVGAAQVGVSAAIEVGTLLTIGGTMAARIEEAIKTTTE